MNSKINDILNQEKVLGMKYVRSILKPRLKNAHKGDYGKLLIVAGSEGMCGAAILASRAALKAGAGLVKVSLPKELFSIIQIANPEAICIKRNTYQVDFSEYDGIAIGSGMGDNEETFSIVKSVLENYSGPVVIDADGLNVISRKSACDMIHNSKAKVIITPHPGEAARLLGIEKNDFLKIPREESANMLAKKTNSISVLKGANTIITEKDGRTYINRTGNPGMATAGSGDVLAGILTALSGQNDDVFAAAAAGVFIHGFAGDLAALQFGETGMTAGDIAHYTAYAIKEIVEPERM